MKHFLPRLLTLTILFASCNPFPAPRNIDWKKEWLKNEAKLKELTRDILTKGSKQYTIGINDFPNNFDYPFDDGFYIHSHYATDGPPIIDSNKITITFYVDRGLVDHYSAFIYTNDSTRIQEYDNNIENKGNDFKIEQNWYMISD